ncbi:MAG: hypothetical protein IK090_09150 [Clostridia bacterium]|nr:hypothetical protein [Clostridia bacterium]
MKKSIALTLCLVLLFPCLLSFASCGGDGDASDATTKTAAATTEPGGYTVTFLVGKKQYKVKAEPGSVPACPVDPVEAAAEDYTVRFTGWDKEIVAVTEDTTYTATYASGAEILAARNGAKGIFTMTYDDAQFDTAKWVNEENKKYGLKGSCMLIAGWTRVTNNLSGWTTLFADGTLEPESHSMNHDTLPAEGTSKFETNKIYNTQPKYQTELVDAQTRLRECFPGSDVLCFAPASNTLSTYSYAVGTNGEADLSRPIQDGGAEKVAKETYFAIRQGSRGIQPLDPTFGPEAGSWYNLKMQGFSSFDEAEKLSVSKRWIDQAIAERGWLIVMCHGIDGPNAKGTSPLEISEGDADKLFAYAGAYVESGDLWSATFGEATKYLRERQNATVKEYYDADRIYVEMQINRTCSDGKYLDENVFNYPLTVEVRVPADWRAVTYRLNGKRETAPVYARDGVTYAMVNVVPGADGAKTLVSVAPAN